MMDTRPSRGRWVAAAGGAIGVLALAGCNLGVQPVTYEMLDPDDFNAQLNPIAIVSGDLDGDGDVDAVVSGRRGYCRLLNDGSGTFTREFEEPFVPHGAASLADVDGDDDLDLVTNVEWAGTGDSLPAVNRNDGTGAFGAVEILDEPGTLPGAMGGLTTADVDGDGDLDILAPFRISQERHIGVYTNDGTGTFGGPVLHSLGYSYEVASPTHLVPGDVDGDGDIDVVATDEGVVSDPSGETRLRTMAGVALNDGDGAFSAGDWFDSGTGTNFFAHKPALTDLDGDGNLDLALGGSGAATTLLGAGDGGFGAPRTTLLPGTTGFDFVAPADIDDDGRADLVAFQNVGDARQGVVAYGDGTGGFDDHHEVGSGTSLGGDGTPARDVEVADIDGDDDEDILFLAGSLGVVENATDGRRPSH